MKTYDLAIGSNYLSIKLALSILSRKTEAFFCRKPTRWKSPYGNGFRGQFSFSWWQVRPSYLSNRIYRSCRVAECSRRSILPRPINRDRRETKRGNSTKLVSPSSRIARIAVIPPTTIRNNTRLPSLFYSLYDIARGRRSYLVHPDTLTEKIKVRAIAHSRDDITVTVRARWISINFPADNTIGRITDRFSKIDSTSHWKT